MVRFLWLALGVILQGVSEAFVVTLGTYLRLGLWATARSEGGGGGRGNTDSRERGQGKDGDRLVKDWKSGAALRQPRSRRNDPWWMREEEKTNPRVLPIYKPWWLDNCIVDESWKVPELRKEANRRGMSQASTMKKAELIEALQKSSMEYDLSDKNFRSPEFRQRNSSQLPACYPEVYEGSSNIAKLRETFLSTSAPPKQ